MFGSLDVDAKTLAKSLGGFLVAGVVLYLFGRVVGWGKILRTFRNADPLWFGLACLSTTLCLAFWAKGWDAVLGVGDVDIPFPTLFVTYVAATFADYVTPFGKAGGGPFVAYVLSTDRRVTYQDSLAGVVTADTLNLVPFFLFAAVGTGALTVTQSVPARADPLVLGLATLAVVVPLVAYAFYRKRRWVQTLAQYVLEPVAARTSRLDADEIERRVEEFYGYIDGVASTPETVRRTLVYAFVGWAFFAAPLYLAGLTLGVTLDPLVVLFVVPASTLAGFVPTPGGLGGVEAAVAGLLFALTPLSLGTAAAVALVYRLASYWYTVAVGGGSALWVVYRA
jgi:hypothetical protein